MNVDDETLEHTPPTNALGEPISVQPASADDGREMESIWRIVEMVTPTTGQGSQSLKNFWRDFMARFRQVAFPLDESRALMVVCHISLEHLTKGYGPKEVLSLLLDERAFSVWTITPPDDGGVVLFRKHAMCRSPPGQNEFTMMANSLPKIALTGVSDWQQAQALMVNTYQKLFPSRTNIPFKGAVYPAELVEKTSRLEREVASQKVALEESARQIKALMEENALALALAADHSRNDDAVRAAEDEASKSHAAVYAKQQRIDELELSMVENRRLLTATNDACSSREAQLNDATKLRLENMQRELDAAKEEMDRLQAENERRRTLWGGGRLPAAGLPLPMAPDVMALFTQQAEVLRLTAQAQADAQRRSDDNFKAMMLMITNMGQGAAPAGPPIITVVPTQTDAKKTALQRVQAILQLFDQDKRALAWKVSEYDHANEPLSYDMDWATERVRNIIVERGGRAATQPLKSTLSNISLLLFDYAGEGLSLDDFAESKAKKIGDVWEKFLSAYLHMSYVLREYVSESLGAALDSLMMNLLHIKAKYPRIKPSSLVYTTQQLLGKLRTMAQLPDRAAVTGEVAATLRLEEGSRLFQTLLNQEFMGVDVGDKRSSQQDNSPQNVKRLKGAVPTRPPLQGAYPCYGWIKQVDPCKGANCQASKKRGFHPHKFDKADHGAPEKAFRDWVIANM